MKPEELETRLQVACSIAREAGALQRRRFLNRTVNAYKFKGPQDYLTATDGEVEALVKQRFAQAFPHDTFLGEEDGGIISDRTWVVDPIDGTANFARGIPTFCISIGFVCDGHADIGVIYAPMVDELFAAATGRGATLNGEPMRVSTIDSMDRALIELGRSQRHPQELFLDNVSRVMSLGAAVRNGGSGSLAVANVAAGRSEAIYEIHMNSWDVLGGLVLVREAGGRINDYLANDGVRDGNVVLAAAPGVAEVLSDLYGVPLL
ncbi:MAG: inositol monophosphatase family protein [Labrys sp. (in: a-proteobacteria)]|jgi:myo-inositol-1(or 4)-monophosphatase